MNQMKHKTPGKIYNVLLIEDNIAHAELVVMAFSKHKNRCNVRHFINGEDAIGFLMDIDNEKNGEDLTPDLILLDLRLPKMDGLEVLKEIKTSGRFMGIPIVVLTTSESDSDIKKAYELNANSYLIKPLGFDAFVEMLDVAGSYWFGYNQKYHC